MVVRVSSGSRFGSFRCCCRFWSSGTLRATAHQTTSASASLHGGLSWAPLLSQCCCWPTESPAGSCPWRSCCTP